jgi:maleylpyruvate isomerase
MSTRQGRPEQVLEMVADGTGLFLGTLAGLDDAALDEPTLLPGWNRRYLVSHVANNAAALRNLLHWARTGEERQMYGSDEEREAGIVAGAAAPAAVLRAQAAGAATALWADLESMPEAAWAAKVITRAGVARYGSEVPWMRVREVYVHVVDLDAGVTFADLPAPFLAALLTDITDRRSVCNGPALALSATDAGASWAVAGTGKPVVVEAPLAALAEWLSGRPVSGITDKEGAPVPALPAWL